MTDITEQKKSEEALRKIEERFQLAVQGTAEGIWDWDLLTGEEWWSDRFRELLGYSEEELPAAYDSWESVLHPEDKQPVLESVRRHLEEGELYHIECRMRTKPGGYRWFLCRGIAARDETGKPVRMAGSIQDITERKQIEEELKKHRENLEELVKERTKELEEKNKDLREYNKLFVDREFRIKELRDRVEELEKR